MKILVAEDDKTTCQALTGLLEKWDYQVVVAEDGNKAWEIMQRPDAPRVAILDWIMPGIDGVELCRRIRERSSAEYVYIIMLTVKKRKSDVMAGLYAGADDYIVKPFSSSELHSRLMYGVQRIEGAVDNKTNSATKSNVVERYFSKMEKIAKKESLWQLHADRIAELGVLLAGVAHEINNPTTYISNSAQNLKMFWQKMEPLLKGQGHNVKKQQKIETILEKTQQNIDYISDGVERILNIVDGLRAFARLDNGEKNTCDVNRCIEQAIELCCNTIERYITIQKDLANDLPLVIADDLQIEQVIINLIINAGNAMEEQRQGTLTVRTKQVGETVIIIVSDTGPGIPESKLVNIWQPFFTTKTLGKGTGLGLAIVRKIVSDHNGQVEVRNKPEGGAEFTITLPIMQHETVAAE